MCIVVRPSYLRDDHGEGDEVHAHRVGDSVVHDIDIFTESVRNTSQGRGIEKGHWCAQNTGDGSVEHLLTSLRTENCNREGEQKHE